MYKRVFLIVLDSVGIGANPTAYKFNDEGSNTLLHIEECCNGINLPNLDRLGLKQLINLKSLKNEKPNSLLMRLNEASVGKDTLTGHLEMMCLKTDIPFKTFTRFPDALLLEIKEKTGYEFIGNYPESGTKIILDLGLEHLKTKKPILYTSSDSVLQIAAHTDVIPLEELYDLCAKVRKITLQDEYKIGRVIARPFKGEYPIFYRTEDRHDYALDPAGTTALDLLKENGFDVFSVGKISDIFNKRGITKSYKTKNNQDGIARIKEILELDFNGLCFVNLVDFDMLYGHRRDPIGYKKALEEFDEALVSILTKLRADDLLLITADHGNDPTFRGTDHTREYVPLICYSQNIKPLVLDDQASFSVIGKTILANFDIKNDLFGDSFLDYLK